MALRRILTYPDPLLHRVAEPVHEFDVDLSNLVSDMVETMRHAPGIGLAAPQIGELFRLVVIELTDDEEERKTPLYAVCNPEIVHKAGHAKIEEGCLSVPDLYVEVDRAEEIRVEGQNPDGTPFSLEADGLLAIVLQHEIDHLNGTLLTNYISSIRRDIYKGERRRAEEEDSGDPSQRRPAL